jgi:hypothetical protein
MRLPCHRVHVDNLLILFDNFSSVEAAARLFAEAFARRAAIFADHLPNINHAKRGYGRFYDAFANSSSGFQNAYRRT